MVNHWHMAIAINASLKLILLYSSLLYTQSNPYKYTREFLYVITADKGSVKINR